jgi:hypothetical protein
VGQKGGLVTESKTPRNSARPGKIVIFGGQKMSVKNLWSFIEKLLFSGVFSLKKTMARPLPMSVSVPTSSNRQQRKSSSAQPHATE